MALLAQIETPRAIIHLKEICESTKRLQALIFGAEDMALGLGATRTSEAWEVFYARSAVVTHAAAFGLQALDMVYTRFEDVEGLRKEAQQGVQLGFSGKQIIHPAQIEPVQAAFTPDDASVANARKVLQTYELEEHAGRGAYSMNGKMVDLPVVMAARNVLSRAEAAGRK
jgi:citrate lyase beta subunit